MELQIFFVFVTVIFVPTTSLDLNAMFDTKSIFKFFKTSASLVQTIATGTQLALDHCQKEFKWDKWNCPENAFKRNPRQITRESAYISAIISSGIVHAVTKNCSKGEIKACKCHPKPQDILQDADSDLTGDANSAEYKKVDWTWGGCSDDVAYGIDLSKHILNRSNDSSDVQSVIEMHNNRIGRQVIRESMVRKCRCHGVSGSCSLQTCWVQVAPFHLISAKLKEKYSKAILVSAEDVLAKEENRTRRDIPLNTNSLIYLEQSPNYCISNNTIDWPGTKGRSCSRFHSASSTLAEKKSCRHLCRSCGHRVRRIKKTVKSKCKCSFAWCCEVKCEICEEVVTEYVCK